MKLYNTLNKKIETIEPQNPPEVTIYTCGPTVYDYPHIGNWFTFVRYDLLTRTLRADGYRPKWVMNITDVGHLVSDADDGEDKLEKGARREHKSAWDVAKYYGDYFVDALNRLNITKPDFLPKATDHIKEQVELIRQLEKKGFTYQISDGVYFDTKKFPTYAKFAGLDLDEQEAGKRVEYNPEKHSISDFALWKFSPKDHKRDMEWDSPWGVGFPGWHIECSAMSMKYLGKTLDIHAGGIDHIPVHHTNEIAQSEASTDQRFANYWMHSNHITIEGEKISKSLGNGITLEDIEKKGYSLQAFRLHVLESHYRSQSKFSWESLRAAQNRLNGYLAVADLRWQLIDKPARKSTSFQQVLKEIKDCLTEDLNTPLALAILSSFSDVLTDELVSTTNKNDFISFLEEINRLLGIDLLTSTDISSDQRRLIGAREIARDIEDFAKADGIRDQLAMQGIGIRDSQHGTIWHRLQY